MNAPVIDGARNIYIVIAHGIKKFSPDGQTLWSWDIPGSQHGSDMNKLDYLVHAPALMGGHIYTCSLGAKVYSVSMETGQVAWMKQVHTNISTGNGSDNAFLVARDDKVLIAADRDESLRHKPNKVVCLNG